MGYRLYVKDEPKGPIRKVHQTAMKDALRCGVARWRGKGGAMKMVLIAGSEAVIKEIADGP